MKQGKALEEKLHNVDKAALTQSLRMHMTEEWQTLCDGALVGCRASQQHKPELDAAVIWQRGSVKLLDYAPDTDLKPVLVIPSLINRAYILDLHPDCSFLRYLVSRGLRPFLVEWNNPQECEREFTPSDYVSHYLVPILSYVKDITNQPPAVMGYCAGGVLSMALVRLCSEHVTKLALLATPWDFHVAEQMRIDLKAQDADLLRDLLQRYTLIPAQMVQAMFYWLYPDMVRQKLRRLARFGKEANASVLAMEHWVNDGIGLTSATAETFWLSWMQSNQLAKGQWQVNGQKITPQSLPSTMPVMVVMPAQDKIVPPASTQPLLEKLKFDPTRPLDVLMPQTGHVGMIVGRNASKSVWQPCADWLLA